MSHPNKSFKDIAHSKRKKYRLAFVAMFFTIGSLIISFFFGEMGFFNFSKMQQVLAQARQEIDLLEGRNADILHEIEGFRTDSFYVEAIARERLGLVKRGEIVYEFYDEAPASRGNSGPAGHGAFVGPLENKKG